MSSRGRNLAVLTSCTSLVTYRVVFQMLALRTLTGRQSRMGDQLPTAPTPRAPPRIRTETSGLKRPALCR